MNRLLSRLLLILLIPGNSWGALAQDIKTNTGISNLSSANTTNATGAFTTNFPNELLVAICVGTNNGATPTSVVTGGSGLTWVKAVEISNANGNVSISWAFSPAIQTAQTVTCTWSGLSSTMGGGNTQLVSYTGSAGTKSAGFTITSNNTGAATIQPRLYVTPTCVNSWIIGGFEDFDLGTVYVAASGNTIVSQNNSATNDTQLIVNTTLPNSQNGTAKLLNFTNAASADHFDFAGMEVKPAACASPTPTGGF